jgi:outer membrane protein insertion porin family
MASRLINTFFSITVLFLLYSFTNGIYCEDNDELIENDETSQAVEPVESTDEADETTETESEQDTIYAGPRVITNIIVEGNRTIPAQAIINVVPYQVGQVFDPVKTNRLIRNVYDLGFFKHVRLEAEFVNNDAIVLIVIVEEKLLLEGVRFRGNRHLSEVEIKKKIDFSKIMTIDEAELPKYSAILKKLYRDKDYHQAQITAHLELTDGKAVAVFDIVEGRTSLVKRVLFQGNTYFTDKKLRSILFTREDWVGGFLDRSGSYQPEAVENDKHLIENYYQSNGFMNARVYDVQITNADKPEDLIVTFYIFEGDQYTISEVKVPGNELVSEEALCNRLPIKAGDLYSREKIRNTIEFLRLLWGEYGYINADIEPSIQPDDDTKTVALGFYTELGSQIRVNRINIRGNLKTHDKVIRRQILCNRGLVEGGLLTTKSMDEAKARVEQLGYFDQKAGVSWKINRINKELVDLDLIVKEVKTGRAELQMGFGGSPKDISSPMESFSLKGILADTNLFGRGIHLNLSGEYSKEEQNLNFNLTEPWLFDRAILAGIDIFFKRSTYDEFSFVKDRDIHERIAGGSLNVGFIITRYIEAIVANKLGLESVTYTRRPIVEHPFLPPEEIAELQVVFDNRFASGEFVWYALQMSNDVRNHPIHPSRGHQWLAASKIAFPGNNPFGFVKFDLDMSWYTPLIGERDLVFGLHGHLGLIAHFKNKTVPFRELYNIGGPASVRGFTFGEIGPTWISNVVPGRTNILGATKAFWINAEMVFPIAGDFSLKGAVFYDGGAGWDTPDAGKINPARLRNNSFNYRHSVGFGVRLLRPTPLKIDWGFKLDPRKGEAASEVHFTAYHEF